MWSNKKICSEEKMYLGGLLSLVFSVLSTYFILRYLAGHYSFNVDLSNIGEIFAITSGFCPEPRERMLFMGGCLIMPAALYLFCNIFSWVLSRVSDGAYIRKVCGVLYFTVITLVYIMILVAIQENNCFFLLNTIGVNPQSLILISAGVFILFWAILFAAPDNKFALAVRLIEWSLLLLSLISILSVCLFCVFGTSSVSIRGVLDVHFNAVFHPVVQVYQGKTLLIDLLSQYGLYPHFLEPILKITGLTVLRFTVVMGALMALSLILIYRFLMGVTRNKIIGYLGFLSMIYYSYHFGRVISIDPYFQYNPIRFLFPAASVYLVYKYFKTNSKKLYYCLFALFSIALLWNFDTGIVVFLGWILVILFQELFKLKFRNIFRHLISGTIVFMAILSLFTVYLYIRSGQLPDYRAFLTHQNLFYLYGYGMMPMRMIHPWNMVILLYVIGLVISSYSPDFSFFLICSPIFSPVSGKT